MVTYNETPERPDATGWPLLLKLGYWLVTRSIGNLLSSLDRRSSRLLAAQLTVAFSGLAWSLTRAVADRNVGSLLDRIHQQTGRQQPTASSKKEQSDDPQMP
jgi:hypothetical protein